MTQELIERAKALREECRKGVEDRGIMPAYVDACVTLNHLAPKLLEVAESQSARIAELEGVLREISGWREKGEIRLDDLQGLMDGAYPEIRKALGPNASFAHSANSAILRIGGPLAQIGFAIDRAVLEADNAKP